MQEPQLFSNAPDFNLGFEIVYITKEFTRYQMAWHYSWVLITLIFMFVPKIGFFFEMLQLHQNFWSRQQVQHNMLQVLMSTDIVLSERESLELCIGLTKYDLLAVSFL